MDKASFSQSRDHRRGSGIRRRPPDVSAVLDAAATTGMILWSATPAGRVIFLNDLWRNITAEVAPVTGIEGWLAAVHGEDREAVASALQTSLRYRTPLEISFRLSTAAPEQTVIHMKGRARFRGSRFIGLAGFARVVKDREDLPPAPAGSQTVTSPDPWSDSWLRSFFASTADGIWHFKAQTPIPVTLPEDAFIDQLLHSMILVECNDALARQYGLDTAGELKGSPLVRFFDGTNPRHHELLREFLKSGFRMSASESSHRDRFGNVRFTINSGVGLVEDGALTRGWGTMTDITDQKIAERKLRLLAQTVTSARDCISITDLEDRILFVNDSFLQTFGYSADELVGTPLALVRSPANPPEVLEGILPATLAGGWYGEILNRDIHGRDVPFEVWTSVVRNDEAEPVAIVSVARDVTERKRAMDQISDSLREKEVLLKEIHHRVKNNLQIISSLLSLQSEYIKDETMLKVFKESQHRVRSMALIHEKLYQSKNLAEINFAEYIRELTMQLVRSFGLTTYGIAVQQDLENISLGIDQAIPCGIVVNELVTNALRYAFPGRQSGLIEVSLRSRPENRIELSVRDNGVGMPPNIDLETADTLGLTLVRMLVDQLQGTVSLVSSPPGGESQGTAFVITFGAGGRP